MKKTVLALLLSVLLYPFYLCAQTDVEDVIYLKNGRIYTGIILEKIPTVSYKIRLTDGRSIRIFYEDVLRISQEPKGKVETYIPPKRPADIHIETSLSYLLYFPGAVYNYDPRHPHMAHGVGFSLFPEIKRGNHFSFLIGTAIQYLPLRNFAFEKESINYGYIDKGYQIRLQVPIWYRWTYGRKLPVFFQFGWSVGVQFYRGWGQYTEHEGFGRDLTTHGWQKDNTGFANIFGLGVGIRKDLRPRIELIAYAEGAPCNFQFRLYDFYQPYAQIHLGINFAAKRSATAER